MIEIKTLEDVQQLAATPFAELDLPASTFDMIEQGASFDPDAPALNFFLQAKGNTYQETESYTFREALGHIRQSANLFSSLGIGKDDVVSFLLPNLPETYWTIWGAESAGIVNPINPLLEARVIADILNAAGTKVLVTLAPFPRTDLWDKVDLIREEVPSLQTILRIDLAEHIQGLGKWMVKAAMITKGRARKIKGQKVLDFNKARSSQPKGHFSFKRDIQLDDIASYFHTGGTTGTPKLAMHTHGNEVFDTWATIKFLGKEQGKGLNFFCGLPLFHVNGVFVTGLGPWSMGAAITLGSPQGYRTPGLIGNFWKIVEHYKLTFFSGVPAVYGNLLNVPVGNTDISSLEFGICGAAAMPVEVFKNFEKMSGVRILEGYGMTEGGCASSVNPPFGERRVGSIGFSLPYQEMKVAILEAGSFVRDAKPDEIGAILIRGANVFPGYKEAIHNKGIWIEDPDGKGKWFITGDLGRQDTEGYFWLTGRKKELIIRGGHNIDPRQIEEPLYKHPAIEMVAAVGSPDPRLGEVPAIFVQLKSGHEVSPEEIYEFAQEHIGEQAAVPKTIHLIDEMPLTAVGKVFKPALIRREIERVLANNIRTIPTVEAVSVYAENDKIHGLKARAQVRANPGADPQALDTEIRKMLGSYTIHCEVNVV